MESIKQKEKKAYEIMKAKFGYTNTMASPKLKKIIVSSGTGKNAKTDKNRNQFVAERLSRITGQKPALRGAKKSIASFKIRQGDPVGLMVTLRGSGMQDFAEKVIHIALPRTKDFRGLNRTSVDAIGNMTFGIKEHTIFPEIKDEELKDVFGMAITMGTTAKTKEEATKFFELIGIPFKKA